jgi:formylglycine-generating enzyme required for sulfatase activity
MPNTDLISTKNRAIFWVIAALCVSAAIFLASSPKIRPALKRGSLILDSYNILERRVDIPTRSQIWPTDGMVMIYIPPGEFPMGTDSKDFQKSRPQHSVYLSGYWIDQTEVSNAMYARCVAQSACKPPVQNNRYYNDPAHANAAVVYIRWEEAQAYCTWAGRRLPTEAEWEKAARGVDGRNYPWGSQLPDAHLLNFDDNIGYPLPVNRYPKGASPYGVLNMAGNVREWVADWYSAAYYRYTPLRNPTGPDDGRYKVLRGGSYLDGWREVRSVNRFFHNPTSPGENRGFRCAASE